MNQYQIEIQRYFSGPESFIIHAEDKTSARLRAKEYVANHPVYRSGNYNLDSIRVVKKLRNKK